VKKFSLLSFFITFSLGRIILQFFEEAKPLFELVCPLQTYSATHAVRGTSDYHFGPTPNNKEFAQRISYKNMNISFSF